ncbi:MAG: Flp pilus assembly complex ATPase component TadA [Actinomycetia bacterium]|nr:Flp pilus assembly complex ATPase component TadA [Actinomycetes bacterium]
MPTIPFPARRRVDLASLLVEAQRQATAPAADPLAAAVATVRERLAAHPDWLRDRATHRPAILGLIQDTLQDAALTAAERQSAYELLSTEYFGFGRLDPYMRDPAVTEILVDGPHHVDVERDGRLECVPVAWRSDEELREYIKGLIRDTGRPLDQGHPLVNAEVSGTRIHATAPPVSRTHTLNIRKSVEQTRRYTPAEYVASGALSAAGMRLLLACARAACNLLICGRTGSGKTTLARILIEAGARPDTRWIMTEDTRETEARVRHWVSLQTVERREQPVTMDDLFAATKRMRPDRIAVGEIRTGDHAAPYVLTTLAGHDGGISTMHAGDEHDAIFNFVFFLKLAGLPVSEEFLERLLHRKLHVLAFVDRLHDGRRRVTRIVEVEPLEASPSGGFRPLVVWDWRTDRWRWVEPLSDRLAERLAFQGVVVPQPTDPEDVGFEDLDAPPAGPPAQPAPPAAEAPRAAPRPAGRRARPARQP